MFQADNVSYIRGGRKLFSRLSFSVSEGKGLHIKGENGAGKSSLLKLIAGIGRADEGDFIWRNENIKENSHNFYSELLSIGHKSGINQHLNAEENLAWYAAISGITLNISERAEIFKRMGLFGFEDIATGKLSAGQQRRIALCRLLVEKKKLWLLDEPLASLDQQGIKLFESLLQNHLQQGGVVIFTSHQDMLLENNIIDVLELKNFKNEQEFIDQGSAE